jgi:hypothetical protein
MEVVECYERLNIYLNPDVLKLTLKYLYFNNILVSKEKYAILREVDRYYECKAITSIDALQKYRCCNRLLCSRHYTRHVYCKKCKGCYSYSREGCTYMNDTIVCKKCNAKL